MSEGRVPQRAINPATGEEVHAFAGHTSSEVARFIDEAHEAHLSWRRTSFSERAALLRRTAAVLRQRSETYARLMAMEMGKP
ncbi:MAG: aldehyde dehydrogenase family protein, partial [Myxococcota bacterium]